MCYVQCWLLTPTTVCFNVFKCSKAQHHIFYVQCKRSLTLDKYMCWSPLLYLFSSWPIRGDNMLTWFVGTHSDAFRFVPVWRNCLTSLKECGSQSPDTHYMKWPGDPDIHIKQKHSARLWFKWFVVQQATQPGLEHQRTQVQHLIFWCLKVISSLQVHKHQ